MHWKSDRSLSRASIAMNGASGPGVEMALYEEREFGLQAIPIRGHAIQEEVGTRHARCSMRFVRDEKTSRPAQART
ncbi:hypothetical protein ACFB49_16940 [Sphingomonas sp. DBB INV C78]